MKNIVFAAPYYVETTVRFAQAVASLPGVRFGLVSQTPLEDAPDGLRRHVSAHWRVDNVLDPSQLAGAVDNIGSQIGSIDGLLGILEHLQEPLALVREKLAIPGLGHAAARRFRDKALMKSALRDAGLPCARHALATSHESARELATEVGFPMVIKPPSGAGAKNTYRIETPQDLDEALRLFQPDENSPLLMEEFLIGAEHSFDSVLIDGAMVWHSISRYLPSPLEVLRHPWIQWCVLLPRRIDDEAFDPIREVALPALRTLGLETGLSHMEWFARPDGSVAISEVGARPPGARITDLLSYAHDTDFYRLWAQLMVFGEIEIPERTYAAGAAYLRGLGSGHVIDIQGLERAQAELGHLVVESRLPTRGQPKADTYEGEGYVILRDTETEVVEQALRKLISTVRVQIG
ncbi:MAG: ATP-grasp domain-containing protein [Acidobacteriota bacterium]